MKRRLQKMSLIILGLALGLLLAEGLLQLFWLPNAATTWHVWPPELEEHFLPVPETMPGIYGPSSFTINSQGFRGAEPDNLVSQILCLGGSTTECLYLDDSEAWPWLVQESFNSKSRENIQMQNAGRSGHALPHHIVQLEKLLPQHPHIKKVLILAGANDFLRRLGSQNEFSLARFRDHIYEKAFLIRPPEAYHNWYKRSAIWHLLRGSWQAHLKAEKKEMIQDQTGSVYTEYRNNRALALPHVPQISDLSQGLVEYEQDIREIARICKKSEVQLFFMTQPVIWSDSIKAHEEALIWSGAFFEPGAEVTYYSSSALGKGMKAYNDRLLQTAQELAIPCLDLSPVIPRDTSIFYDDMHFNESGARAIARHCTFFLQENL